MGELGGGGGGGGRAATSQGLERLCSCNGRVKHLARLLAERGAEQGVGFQNAVLHLNKVLQKYDGASA